MKASKKEFIAEAEDLLFECQQLVIEIQGTYQTALNPDTINALFRYMHTLKGLSGLFGNKGITDISHALESLLDEIRLGKILINDTIVNFLFKNIDILRSAIDGVKEDQEPDLTEDINNIKTFRTSLQEMAIEVSLHGLIDESIVKVLSEYEEHRLKTNIKSGNGIYLLKAVFDLSTFDKSLEETTKIIKSKGELISTLPTSADVPNGSIGFNLMFSTNMLLNGVKEHLGENIEVLVQGKQTVVQPQKKQEQSIKSTTTTVRVDIDKLDRILNTIGELTLAKDAVKRIGKELADAYHYSPFVQDINKISQTLERKLTELQDEVLEIRMVPVGQIFSRLAQVIRRYSREIGKEIELNLYGEDTELDKSLAEEIVDPLMHLVRNSLDHGIEPSEERKKKGKKENGRIVLKAFQRGNHVVIEVKDDGGGIDTEKVRETAIKKGLLEPDAKVEEREFIDFIFNPGFSTKDVVSEISGRGVGLDVVKEKLSALGGFIEVYTKKDKGTTFTLTLPITLAIIKALIIKVGQEKFGIPITTISETIAIELQDIQTIEWKDVYYLRGEMLPIISIAKIFNIETKKSDFSFAIIVGFGKKKIGLLVDEIIGQHEIVIKSLGEYFKGLSGFAGAAEIGRHEVLLILDIESIMEKSLIKQEGASRV
ncbi:MAG: chemotaxis protein CheA [Nitrospira sp.]|nr:chemotaxis protein CheA [Nitrospira sp.]